MKTLKLTVPALVVLAGVYALVFLTGQGGSAVPSDSSLVVQANNQFALDLYQKLRRGDENLFFSPYSMFTALGMTYAGARGNTQDQMAQTMSLPTSAAGLKKLDITRKPVSPTAFAQQCGGLIKNLNAAGAGGKYELTIANALWGQMKESFVPDYLKLVETEYGGKLDRVDFAQPAQAAGQINAWVGEQTRGQITNLIDPNSLGRDTSLVLTNAIYFKGSWLKAFPKTSTGPLAFRSPGQAAHEVATMQYAGTLGFARTGDIKVLELCYADSTLSMVILLPNEDDGIARLESQLTGDALTKWLGSIREVQVHASLPKFKGTETYDMIPALESLGMTDVFSGRANLSAMITSGASISGVIHRACVDVDEMGTVAAAATALTATRASGGGGPTVFEEFKAEHPFLYLIRDRSTSLILFLGRMMDPASV